MSGKKDMESTDKNHGVRLEAAHKVLSDLVNDWPEDAR